MKLAEPYILLISLHFHCTYTYWLHLHYTILHLCYTFTTLSLYLHYTYTILALTVQKLTSVWVNWLTPVKWSSYLHHTGFQSGSMIEWGNHWARGLKYRQQNGEAVCGFFSHIGDLNMCHHLWSYKSLQSRKETRDLAWQLPGWDENVRYTGRWPWHLVLGDLELELGDLDCLVSFHSYRLGLFNVGIVQLFFRTILYLYFISKFINCGLFYYILLYILSYSSVYSII